MKNCNCCGSEMVLTGAPSTHGQYWTCISCGNVDIKIR